MAKRVEIEAPTAGSRWDEVGVSFATAPSAPSHRTVRVMAVAENYVMARFQGCAPFTMHVKDWGKRFEPESRPSPAQKDKAE